MTTHIPYGYRIEEGRAVPDEVTARKVQELFEEYIKLGSMRMAAKVAGIEKTHSFIGKMLKNELYLGTAFYPRLIDNETFDKAQEKRLEYQKAFNRIHEFELKEEAPLAFRFKAVKVKRIYDDPYKQAAYAYSKIEEDIE